MRAGFAIIFFAALVFLPIRASATTLIYSGDEFAQISAEGDYALAADIFLPSDRVPISVFRGTLDGAGFEIRGATNPLFWVLDGAEIRNLALCGAEMHVRGDTARDEFAVGILAGKVNGGVIEGVDVFGGVIANEASNEASGASKSPETESGIIGGLIGAARDADIKNIRMFNVQIVADEGADLRAVGGLAGVLQNCRVADAVVLNTEIRVGARSSGGFVGLVRENSVFEDCHAVAEIHENESPVGISGGFAGLADGSRSGVGAEFSRCRAGGSVRAATAGGFVGRLSGRSRVAHSHVGGVVSAENAGGFAGEITNASRIEFSSAVSAVFGAENAGGFVAIIAADGAPNTITNSLALGNIVASESGNARRFAARLDHDGINNCYAALGMAIIHGENSANAVPNPYSADGGDIPISRAKRAVGTGDMCRGRHIPSKP
ncbi:MAG: hypothetical protein FWF77_02115 [Defluviitaleaceae bacterium]|nr:hypothetical protein [Defluviitaleaceae bacterium]